MFSKPNLPEFIEVNALELGTESTMQQIQKRANELFQDECKKAYDSGYEDCWENNFYATIRGALYIFLIGTPSVIAGNFFSHRIEVGDQMLRDEYAACARGDAGLCSRGVARNDEVVDASLLTTYQAATGKDLGVPTSVVVTSIEGGYTFKLPDGQYIKVYK